MKEFLKILAAGFVTAAFLFVFIKLNEMENNSIQALAYYEALSACTQKKKTKAPILKTELEIEQAHSDYLGYSRTIPAP